MSNINAMLNHETQPPRGRFCFTPLQCLAESEPTINLARVRNKIDLFLINNSE